MVLNGPSGEELVDACAGEAMEQRVHNLMERWDEKFGLQYFKPVAEQCKTCSATAAPLALLPPGGVEMPTSISSTNILSDAVSALSPECSAVVRLRLHIDLLPLYPMHSAVMWNGYIKYLIARHGRLKEIYLWISSLGAAHSALGIHDRAHAEKAELTAHEQAKLARLLGDDALQARCLVYVAIAQTHQGD